MFNVNNDKRKSIVQEAHKGAWDKKKKQRDKRRSSRELVKTKDRERDTLSKKDDRVLSAGVVFVVIQLDQRVMGLSIIDSSIAGRFSRTIARLPSVDDETMAGVVLPHCQYVKATTRSHQHALLTVGSTSHSKVSAFWSSASNDEP